MKKFYVLDDSGVAPPPEYLALNLSPYVEADNAEEAMRIVKMRRDSAIRVLKESATEGLKQPKIRVYKRTTVRKSKQSVNHDLEHGKISGKLTKAGKSQKITNVEL